MREAADKIPPRTPRPSSRGKRLGEAKMGGR